MLPHEKHDKLRKAAKALAELAHELYPNSRYLQLGTPYGWVSILPKDDADAQALRREGVDQRAFIEHQARQLEFGVLTEDAVDAFIRQLDANDDVAGRALKEQQHGS